MRRLGQHFLKNKYAVKKIIDALELGSDEAVIEVGAGHGELTAELNNESRIMNKGPRIIAIEKDEKLAENLEFRIKNLGVANVKVVRGDALKFLKLLPKSSIINSKSYYKIVGNIPYYITGHLLRIIGELKNKPRICVFTLQKEVAKRITAEPPKMNLLAASVQFWASPKIMGRISKKEFRPAPKVDSSILKLETRADMALRDKLGLNYYKTVKILFAQPRKTILNNLSAGNLRKTSVFPQKSPQNKLKITEKLKKIGVNPQSRPQNLNVGDIIKISRLL